MLGPHLLTFFVIFSSFFQVALSPQLDATMWDLQIQGKTAICVAVNQVIVGVLGLADTAKEEAYSTIRALHALNIDVWMVRLAF